MADGIKGRGSALNTPNRFEHLHLEPLDLSVEYEENAPPPPTQFYADNSRSILAKNDSPDLPFTYSVNPYRGCEHGCIYCYARPSHEYLGFSAGLDFETKIMVKMKAPELLEDAFQKKSWDPQVVALSGNTDCYQPAERKLRLTRRCLEVFLKYRNPVSIVTKNAMILRDVDILTEMAAINIVHVMVSVTSLDEGLVRRMEPRTSRPDMRLRAIEELARNGIPVGVNAAPIVPGLTDEELPNILRAAAERGATSAGYILVRLPGAVKQLFIDWLRREYPERAEKVLNRIKDTRGGKLNDARFGVRQEGEGEIAKAINDLFTISIARLHLSERKCGLSVDQFVCEPRGQMEMF